MLFIARPAARGAVLPTPVSDVEASLSAARRFHDRLVGGLNRLRDQVAEWRDHGQRVAVYGGGMHTRALFELADLDLATVTAVIDEDPAKAGTAIAGIPVISFSEAIAAAPDVILISTLASEDALLDRLPGKVPAGTRIFGIYRHFFE
jgi:FlaA1/EpsC-like NDP-sugar epimerase